MFHLEKPNESEADLLRQMCATLDAEEQPSVVLFEPMLDDEHGMWFSTQVFALNDGEHPIQMLRRLMGPEGREYRAGARAVGLVSFGQMFKLPEGTEPEDFATFDREAMERLPRVRCRTQAVIAGGFAWGKTVQLDNEGVVNLPSTVEDHLESSPLITACQYLLALAAGIAPDPPTGGEG